MATCVKLRRKSTRVCIGSLDKLIELQLRTLGVPVDDSSRVTETFTTLITVPAMIETIANRTFFSNTNTPTEGIRTHDFYIRYIPGTTVDIGTWIKYDGEEFRIIGSENLNEEGRFLWIRTTVRGPDTVEVNKA
jgi:head-tail adaptor